MERNHATQDHAIRQLRRRADKAVSLGIRVAAAGSLSAFLFLVPASKAVA